MKKTVVNIIVVAVIVGGAAFYGGMKYGQSTVSNNFPQGGPAGFQRMQQRGQGQGQFGNRDTTGFASGEIISKDDKSITVKLRDGGSKIIFYSDATEVGKFTNGTSKDFETGKTVTVNGKGNADGSITAQSIQMRPESSFMPPPMPAPTPPQ